MDWDDNNVNLRFDINLENIAAIAVAEELWYYEDIQNELMSFFGEWKKFDLFRSKQATWKDITGKVCEHAQSLKLPKELLSKVEKIAVGIGHEIRDWNNYLCKTLSLTPEFSFEIYWTFYGTVDENKIFQKHWKKLNLFKIAADTDALNNCVIFLSCIFAQEKFIRENLNQIRKVTELHLAPGKLKNPSPYCIITMWLCIYFTNSKKEGVKLYNKSLNSKTLAGDLLTKCIEHGLLAATKYFWRKLNEDEKLKFTADKCAKKVLEVTSYYCTRTNHKLVKWTEILIFFINEMHNDEKIQFISENILPIFKLCKYWPFQEVLLKVLINEQIMNQINSDELYELFSITRDCIPEKCQNERFINKDFCRQILPRIFERIPKDMKLVKIFGKNRYNWYSDEMFSCFDISILSTIFNDRDLAEHKIKLVEFNRSKFKQLIKSKKLEELNEFAVKVFPLENEQKEFKLRMNFVSDLIVEGNFSLADELLNWISDSDEEKLLIKNQIDSIEVFSAITDRKIMDDFLIWRYDNEEERRSAKRMMRQNEFLAVKVIKMWNKNGQVNENKCSEFLKWFMDENEALEFKRLMIIDENFVRRFWENLFSLKFFKRIDELFKFLSLTPEEIKEIKQKLIETKNEWILTYFVSKKNFKLADEIIGWIFTNSDQKEKAMGEYINSENGALLLLKTFMNCGLNYGEGIVFLLNDWVKLYGDVCIIKHKLKSIVTNDFFETSGKHSLMSLLDRLENQWEISTKSLSTYF